MVILLKFNNNILTKAIILSYNSFFTFSTIFNKMYQIARKRIDNDGNVKDYCVLPIEFKRLDECNSKIKDYAESWRKESWKVMHGPGESVVFFKAYRVEFYRLPTITNI